MVSNCAVSAQRSTSASTSGAHMKMLSLTTLSFLQHSTSLNPILSLPNSSSSSSRSRSTSRRRISTWSTATTAIKMSTQETVEHVVLFKVKPDTSSSKIDSMISNLRSLVSLPAVLHLTAGPIHLNRSSSFNFTHLLHSRYSTKEDLAAYSSHPSHLNAVRTSVLPICEDIMAVDWIADLHGPIVPLPNGAMRLTLLKVKESEEEKEKGEILSVVGGIDKEFAEIEQLSFGENFSPERAKGFSIASIAIFAGLKEMEGLDEKGEMVEMQKAKVRDLLEDVIVVDYVIPPPPSANL